MADPTFIEVQKALAGIEYPAGRDDLVRHARNNSAGDHVLDALREIEDRDYEGPNEVSSAVSDATGGH
ncbi:DUF2795 domain-containing protein [Actinorugispora endophytica]|uniref:Uncharacterized protein DUF2795 n=1 Tax=Actinorugispora endophytica TaxID=1605990 RepID=A0A4R6V0U0_9ACTN|nr:DUF2795 domain-containing protein [Actinorugispora endophytica]TDQ51565.1 uncharacterized protein DUF2795 [Actinorugispora endophytica]